MVEKVLLENESVRVVEVRLPPGARIDMHTHPKYVAYTLNPAKLRFTFPDGTKQEVQTEKGAVKFSKGITHEVENIGSTEMLGIDVEIKNQK